MQDEIHLSVVAISRNDNHGGFLTRRMQHFVDGLVAQCKRHGLRAELIMVEWNPPAERRPLAEELVWPADGGPCEIRVVTVSREVHARLEHAAKLPLYQMIAKNVGIRRARGRFVLATNIDILFSDAVIRCMRDDLLPRRLYRVDRVDVPTHVPGDVAFDEVLAFCEREAFRLNANNFTLVKRDGRWRPGSTLQAMLLHVWHSALRWMQRLSQRDAAPPEAGAARASPVPPRPAYPRRFAHNLARLIAFTVGWMYHGLLRQELFTNACGDFTLLAREDWFALRGYPEWAVYSWNLDSILLYQAHRSGLREIYLGEAARIYHIEHAPGSGFTPESSAKLFARLREQGVPYLEWQPEMEALIAEMDLKRRRGDLPIVYNGDDWGYAGSEFPEQRVTPRRAAA